MATPWGQWLCNTHQGNHVDHGRIASDEEEERDLDSIRLVEVARDDLVDDQTADEVVLGVLHAGLDKLREVVDEALARSGRLTRSRAAVRANRILVSEELEVLERDAKDRVDNLGLVMPRTLTCEGTGSANSCTRSAGPWGPYFCAILSSRSSTVFWMYGRRDFTCSGVKSPSTMPLVLACRPHTHRWCMWSGLSMSTNVGLALAASLPPAFSSGKPGRVRTLDRRSSVATLHTSLYFVTSQAEDPSYSWILDTGSVARSLANSGGGSMPDARLNGNVWALAMLTLLEKQRLGASLRSEVTRDDIVLERRLGVSIVRPCLPR